MPKHLRYLFGILCCGWFLSVAAPVWAVDSSQLQQIDQAWQLSVHALNDINCSSCHVSHETQEFVAVPDQESCRGCHEQSVDTFLYGKHGIRIHEGLSPLTPAMSHLPMLADARDKAMNCNTCHDVHSVNTVAASVDSCLTCHDDTHSQNYLASKHGQMWLADQVSLPRPSANAVSCSTCHLPRHEEGSVVLVNHNNTYNLKPRDRMVKDVCLNCHGVEFAYNSIFDDDLIENNFAEEPKLKMETFDLLRAYEKRRSDNDSG
ncbi:MAG: hypothetical protein AAGG02_10010 [Cyanobacteria bacterium P01_H01_bin.15]